METAVHFSSKNAEYGTPLSLFDKLNAEFYFQLDPAATRENHLCKKWFAKKDNGLIQIWDRPTFVNPPYGREIGEWVKKAYLETMVAEICPVAVLLLPARPDTRWFHDFCWKSHQIRLIKGRIKFIGAKNSAPFPSMLVIFLRGNKSPVSFVPWEFHD